MLVVWRGYGWAVPLIVFGSFILTQVSLETIFHDAFYKENEWPKIVAIFLSSIIIGILSYIVNYKKRVIIRNKVTGDEKKSPSHTLFFIPIEYWTVIVVGLFFLMQNYTASKKLENITYLETPIVNDLYQVDFTKIDSDADSKFKYGVIKVTSVNLDAIETTFSKVAYDQKSGVRKDIRDGKAVSDEYYYESIIQFTTDELLELHEVDGIYSVTRKI